MAKDAFGNFVAAPLANQAQDAALEATGLDGIANQVPRLALLLCRICCTPAAGSAGCLLLSP